RWSLLAAIMAAADPLALQAPQAPPARGPMPGRPPRPPGAKRPRRTGHVAEQGSGLGPRRRCRFVPFHRHHAAGHLLFLPLIQRNTWRDCLSVSLGGRLVAARERRGSLSRPRCFTRLSHLYGIMAHSHQATKSST